MASGPPRILYFVHDNPAPSGGVWTIYTHISHLNRNGSGQTPQTLLSVTSSICRLIQTTCAICRKWNSMLV
jgi:hypothetical protein